MGQPFTACCPDEIPKTTEEYEPTSRKSKKIERAQSISSNGGSTDGYEASTSRDDDSKSLSGAALSDHELEIAYDGWKKAIEHGNETLATFYVEQQYPDIDFLDYRWDNGDSSLHIACKNKKARLVFFLLTQGASVNDQNSQTLNTSLHYAVEHRDEKIVDLLMKWEADPNVMNKDKETPITISSQFRDKSIYTMLTGSDDDYFNPNFNRLKTNADRFAALQLSVDVLRAQASADAKDVLGIINEKDVNKLKNKPDNYKRKKEQEIEDVIYNNANRASINEEEYKQKQKELELAKGAITSRTPFGGLGYIPPEKRKEIVRKNLNQKPLPNLEAWLEKRKPGGVVPTYQKRWIVVKGAHMLWSSKQRQIINDSDRKERKKFNGSIHLQTIETISSVKTTNNTKFMVKAKDAKKGSMREYIFRCQNKRERDFWVNGLKAHKKQYQIIMSYLGKGTV